MPSSNNLINGKLTVLGLPDLECYESLKALLLDLPNILGVLIPESVTNVIVSNIQPTSGQRTSLWYRLSNGGTFIGLYIFSNGIWTQIVPVPGQVTFIHGDSANPPEGYILTDTWGAITNAEKAHYRTFWFPAGPGPYTYFSVVPVGS